MSSVPVVSVVAWAALAIAIVALSMAIHLQIKVRRYMRWNWAGMARGVWQSAENAWGNIPPEHRDRIKAKVATLAEQGLNRIETASPW